jgi:hypothetical protein
MYKNYNWSCWGNLKEKESMQKALAKITSGMKFNFKKNNNMQKPAAKAGESISEKDKLLPQKQSPFWQKNLL